MQQISSKAMGDYVDSNGKVTAVSSGNATITATAGEESANYEVTVEQPKKVTTSNKTYSSSSSNSAAVTPSNPAPVVPAPAQPDPAPAQPDPQPEQPSNGDNGGSGDSGNSGGDTDWWGTVIPGRADNSCTDEERAAALC